jgi:HSP20 family protein
MLLFTRPNRSKNGLSGYFPPDPFAMLDRFEREFARTPSWPELNVHEDKDKITLSAELPGVSASALDVSVNERTLTILAKASAVAPEGYETRRKERVNYTFSRELTLGEQIDASAITASLKDGVMTITLPKRPESQPKKIAIST